MGTDCGVEMGPARGAEGFPGVSDACFSTDVADDVRVVWSCVRIEAARRSCTPSQP